MAPIELEGGSIGFWNRIKRSYNEGRDKANCDFEEREGHRPEETIQRGWDRGKQAAADGKSIWTAMGRDDGKQTT